MDHNFSSSCLCFNNTHFTQNSYVLPHILRGHTLVWNSFKSAHRDDDCSFKLFPHTIQVHVDNLLFAGRSPAIQHGAPIILTSMRLHLQWANFPLRIIKVSSYLASQHHRTADMLPTAASLWHTESSTWGSPLTDPALSSLLLLNNCFVVISQKALCNSSWTALYSSVSACCAGENQKLIVSYWALKFVPYIKCYYEMCRQDVICWCMRFGFTWQGHVKQQIWDRWGFVLVYPQTSCHLHAWSLVYQLSPSSLSSSLLPSFAS